jgi:uncharacterized protein (TIGR00251 family)
MERPDAWATLDIYVQPRASRTEVVGVHGHAIKIRVAAPPVEGAANVAILRFLAKQLRVRPTAITLIAGASSRKKRVRIEGVTDAEARSALLR